MGNEKRKPGRPRKEIGLGPPLRQVGNGSELREMQQAPVRPDGSVLPPPRPAAFAADAAGRQAPASVFPNAGRAGGAGQGGVPDVAGGHPGEGDDFAGILKRVLSEAADTRHQRVDGRQITNLEAFVRSLVDRALTNDRESSSLVAAYVAGKPGRAADPKQEDRTAEEALERAGIDLLNSLVPQAKEA